MHRRTAVHAELVMMCQISLDMHKLMDKEYALATMINHRFRSCVAIIVVMHLLSQVNYLKVHVPTIPCPLVFIFCSLV